jgi:hypothetical protein
MKQLIDEKLKKWITKQVDKRSLWNKLMKQCFNETYKLMKQQVDETTSWWNNKLMKQQVDETTSWWNNKLMKQQVDETTSWWNNKLIKQQVDETTSWSNNKLMKQQVDETTSCENVSYIRCQSEEMTWHQKHGHLLIPLLFTKGCLPSTMNDKPRNTIS